MKRLIFLIFVLLLSCDGTLGGFDNRIFPTSKKNIENAITSLFIKNPELKIPDKWKIYDDWEKRGYNFLDSRIFYFDTKPEEMYYVTFVGNGDDKQNEKGPTILAIRAVSVGDNRWILYDEFSPEQKEKIEQRFDEKIISEIEKITGVKAIREK